MTDQRPPGVLGSLPRTRPHRRSAKRPASGPDPAETVTPATPAPSAKAPERTPSPPRSANTTGRPKTASSRPKAAARRPKAASSPAKPAPSRPKPAARRPEPAARPLPPPTPEPSGGAGTPLQTAVQAAAELAEIGLMASARALRGALSRLPRP